MKNQSLRRGYTTGSCAAAAASAAVTLLFAKSKRKTVVLTLPGGQQLELAVHSYQQGEGYAQAAVQKDSGDDPDVTNGILIYARAQRNPASREVAVTGGEGIGRVTRPGLACPVGAFAINPTPLRMIAQAARAAALEQGYSGGLRVTISAPEGVRLAEKTYNPRLGIVGGISILGTSGMVEPMSEQALVASIQAEMRMLHAEGAQVLAAAPGNYGRDFLRQHMQIDLERAVKCSNFIGETVDFAVQLELEGLLLVGHVGKLVKLAGGVMNTHSRWADCRMEILTAHAAMAGAESRLARELMSCAVTEEALALLKAAGLLEPVMQSVTAAVGQHLQFRSGKMAVGAILFSQEYGVLGKTAQADALAARIAGKER